MKVEAWGQTDIGLKRENNQDSILVDKELGLYIVADGMGGHKGGEVASSMAVETFREIVSALLKSKEIIHPVEIIKNAYTEATARIYHKSTIDNPDLAGMGTTLVCALVQQGSIYFGNVGDSRAYLILDRNLWQLTEDHSLVNEQIKAGVIKPSQIDEVVGKNVITRSVGFEKNVNPDILVRRLHPGERYILCSDGLCGMIDDESIGVLSQRYNGENLVKSYINAAKKAGGDDNISVVVIDFLS